MFDEQTPSSDYVKGFNEGYSLSAHMPELAEKIVAASGSSDRSAGFQDGRTEYLLEKQKERDVNSPSWLKSDRLSNLYRQDPDKDREKDRGDLERD